MTITNRLTLFFQLALGLVLVGFSLALYCLASWHLHAQCDRQLQAAMDLLVAAIEVHDVDVQWEPHERKVTLGDNSDQTAVRWTIRDEAGKLIDSSTNLADIAWPTQLVDWRILGSQVSAGQFVPVDIAPESLVQRDDAPAIQLPKQRDAQRSMFVMTVGLSNAPVNAELRALALTLVGVSLIAWLMAGIGARWLCRRALHPVHAMAQSARQLQTVPDSEDLLSVPTSNDELTDLGRSFNGLLGTLREAIERQARFAGDASHQLRTPLTATQTAVDVALRRERSPAEYQRVLTIVQRRSRELTTIVETLLALARHPDPNTVAVSEVDLNQACRERIDAWSDHLRAKDLRLLGDESRAKVKSNPILIAQIIDNLLDNACKYSEPGSPIVIRTSTNSSESTISIADQGLGIAAHERAQIFEPFFRSAQARWHGSAGVGLGLTIATRLAAIAGCRIELSSEVGSGSEFRLVFPAHWETTPAITTKEACGVGKC